MQQADESILGAPLWRVRRGRLEVRFIGRTRATLDEILAALPERPREVSWLRQVHSDRVLTAAPGCPGEGDALTAGAPGLALAIATADCVPVVAGGEHGVVAIHAGWRGIAAGIVERALKALAGLGPAAGAWIGPAIGPCCYEVGEDVAARVVAASAADARLTGAPGAAPRLDLAAAVTAQLTAGGVSHIERLGGCTRCDSRLSSYRRDGAAAGRNWTLAWLSGPAAPQP